MDEKTLQQMFAELRSKSLRDANKAEKRIRASYKALLKDLQGFVGEEYAKLAKDGTLSYSILQQKGEYARFLEECTKRIDGISVKMTNEIQDIVRQTYELTYTGMVDAVSNAKDYKQLKEELKGVKASTPASIKRAVENPIPKLTLKDTLENKRHEIKYNIRKQVAIGLTNGDRYDEMARRLAECLDGDYKKSIRIIRTEAHRVREQGFNDAAVDCSNAIKRGDSGLLMVKIWRTGQDKRVRDTHASMEGVTVLADEEFELPSGATTQTPGNSGMASEDINCRCFASYKLMTVEEYEKASGKSYGKANKEKQSIEDMTGQKLFGATEEQVKVKEINGAKRVKIQTDDVYSSVLFYDDKTIFIDEINIKNQGQGTGAKFFENLLSGAKENGYERIQCLAAGDSDSVNNGYYTWARFGFDSELSRSQKKAVAKELGIQAETVQDIMSAKGGSEWWLKHGSALSMEFDLSEDSVSMKVWNEYIAKKKKKK